VPSIPSDDLRPDCERCVGLCCVAPAFSVSADFAIDKKAGQPCLHLQRDSRCAIHPKLRREGFGGCVAYDCYGAGQKVTQLTFGGGDWRTSPGTASAMFGVFAVMRQLHELAWYLTAALALPAAEPVHPDLRAALDGTERLTLGSAEDLAGLDVAGHRQAVNTLLLRASELARARAGATGADRRGADLIGRDLRRMDLRGANLRGALLIGANVRGADLTLADVTGADIRGAEIHGARLASSLFLTQSQVDAAAGDAATTLPPSLNRPAHWPASRQ
jgi:uncharacterized protein YjbI with pentapeptide repeats